MIRPWLMNGLDGAHPNDLDGFFLLLCGGLLSWVWYMNARSRVA